MEQVLKNACYVNLRHIVQKKKIFLFATSTRIRARFVTFFVKNDVFIVRIPDFMFPRPPVVCNNFT